MSLSPSPSATLYEPSLVDEMSANIRAQVIPWEAYQRGRMITQEQLDLIKAFDKKDQYETDSLLERQGNVYAKLFLDLLKGLSKDNTVQYILTLVDDIISANRERVRLFHSRDHENYPFTALLKCLDREDDYIVQKANKILTDIICSGVSISTNDFKIYLDWLIGRLKSTSSFHQEISIRSLMNLFMVADVRLKFFQNAEGPQRLVDILKKQTNFQIRYQVTFCLWLLTFSKPISEKLHQKHNVIAVLVDNIKATQKEKVMRVSIAALRNLLEKSPEANIQAFSDLKVLALCQSLSSRKWTDPDVVEDLTFLLENLNRNLEQQGTFDEYAAEVRSGKLEWSPSHRSEAFWKQNVDRFNERDHEILKILARILSTSTEATALAIACHDIGEYVRHYPRGKKPIQQLGAKQRIMELMGDSDPTVRYEALVAVQKFMVTNWEYLQKTTTTTKEG